MVAERKAFCVVLAKDNIYLFFLSPSPPIKDKTEKEVFKHFFFLLVLINITNARSDLAELCGRSNVTCSKLKEVGSSQEFSSVLSEANFSFPQPRASQPVK